MTSAPPRLSRVSTAIAIVFTLAAVPASAAGYLKLGTIKGDVSAAGDGKKDFYKGWIELNSWSWGETRTSGKMHLEDVSAASKDGAKGGNVEFEWKVEEGENEPPRPGRPGDVTMKRGASASGGVEREMKESGEKGGTEDINIGVGELQEATGRRQHKPMTITKEVDKSTPLLRGSVTTLVPAGTCRLGARYPTAELGTGARVYTMTGVVVTSCSAAASGGSAAMEHLSLNYEKIVWK